MKSKASKILFILSFVPYILAVYCIIFSICRDGIEPKQLLRVLENTFESFIVIPIIPASLTFQLCYIFRKKRKAMFKCTFIPYLFALLVAFKYSIFGATFLGDTVYYGLEGFEIGLIGAFLYHVMYYPILPICLIFQIVVIVLNKKVKHHI